MANSARDREIAEALARIGVTPAIDPPPTKLVPGDKPGEWVPEPPEVRTAQLTRVEQLVREREANARPDGQREPEVWPEIEHRVIRPPAPTPGFGPSPLVALPHVIEDGGYDMDDLLGPGANAEAAHREMVRLQAERAKEAERQRKIDEGKFKEPRVAKFPRHVNGWVTEETYAALVSIVGPHGKKAAAVREAVEEWVEARMTQTVRAQTEALLKQAPGE